MSQSSLPPKGSRIYLSGPMTGKPEYNYPEFHRVAKALRRAGYAVFNPAESFDGNTTLSRETYMRKDIEELLQCSFIVMLDQWYESKGACLEHAIATELGVPWVAAATVLEALEDTKDHFPRIIGLCGAAGAGKDTVGNTLAPYGYVRVSFADKLRALALKMNPRLQHFTGFAVELNQQIAWEGWDKAKRKSPEVRAYLQKLGVACRDVLGADVWIDAIRDDVKKILDGGGRVVITDVRFTNEIDFIRSLGGGIWRVDRPSLLDSGDKHVSEREWRNVGADVVVQNDGAIGDIKGAIRLSFNSGCDIARAGGCLVTRLGRGRQ